jgi:hypothetical protein
MSATPRSMLKVVSSGLQDIERLNAPQGQPSIKFYTHVFRRRTRWASQWRRVEFDNHADFGKKATVTLPILGELITRAVLVIQLPDLFSVQDAAAAVSASGKAYPHFNWTNSTGHAIASSVQFSIGEQVVDTVDSRLCEVLNDVNGPVEHFISTTELLQREPSGYPGAAEAFQKSNDTLEIVYPFWWNRGIGPQALPIQALSKDKVQIDVQFRTVQQLIYSVSRTAAGGLPTIAGHQLYSDEAMTTIHEIAGYKMPDSWHFLDAYWIVEYVSLEEREAAAFRQADLQIPFEQHVALPVVATEGAKNVRIRLERGGLIKDMTWVAQRIEAPAYNAYFLFSHDLSPDDFVTPQQIWWPNASIPSWDYGDGYIRPAFCDRRSDPIQAAALYYRGKERFNFEGPSLFRSLIPALGSERTPLINRYIYRWDFGFWPTGGLAEALHLRDDEMRGAANWDKLPGRDLLLTMKKDDCPYQRWVPAPLVLSTFPLVYEATDPAGLLVSLVDEFRANGYDGARFELQGSDGGAGGGGGAYVSGILDFDEVSRLPGFLDLKLRLSHNGSAAVVLQQLFIPVGGGLPENKYTWLAVAGSGGLGSSLTGGNAGSAVEIASRGGDQAHTHVAANFCGGGGGGRLSGPEPPGPGLGAIPGIKMPTDYMFVQDPTQQTGGTYDINYRGGDGYYGGGADLAACGGGGSYVSPYMRYVDTRGGVPLGVAPYRQAKIIIHPLIRITRVPKFNIHIWLQRYNMLRIYGGRGAVMFAE